MTDLKKEKQDKIIEGEIISREGSVVADDQSRVLSSLEEMIKTHIASIDRLSEEKSKLGEMLADGFNNDAAFREASNKVKEANKAKALARNQIINRPGIIDQANKLKSVSSELKEKQLSLSDYLLEYQRLADGVNEIEGYDGEVREIIHMAKLVKKASKK